MDALIQRVKTIIDTCWESFSAKVGGGLIDVNKEASMQLHFAYILKNSIDLIIHHQDESVTIELETGIPLNGRLRECDIVIKIDKCGQTFYLPIEMKCYKTRSSSGGLRGAQDLFRHGVYEDMELLESYVDNKRLLGIQLSLTDHKNFAHPKSKDAKSWDYDISDGNTITGGVNINTPIGGKPASITLNHNYQFNWKQIGDYYFLKLQGY